MRDELSPTKPGDPAPYAFSYAGATIAVEEEGGGDRSFVLVHGIGMGRGAFRDLTDHLASTALVIAMDLPGFGDAPEPARTLTVERTADLLAAYLNDRRPPRITLVGHSMGSQVITELVVRHPGIAERVVLVAPTVNIRERRGWMQLLRLLQDITIESPRVWLVGAREYLRAGPHLRGKMRAMIAHHPEDSYPRVDVPALVLRGEHDDVCPNGWARFVVEAIPDARLFEVEGHGHETLIRDASAAAARILAFTDETS